MADHWWRTIEFLSLVGSSGVVLNPDKFQFCQKTVDFAGFRISSDGIAPLPKYTDAIRFFPTPKNRTDIKSWFGLVNQETNYNQLRDLMAPFRHLLSSKEKFAWTDDLDKSFNRSRQMIVDLIEKGVRIFDPDKKTCLRPDWSKKGIGYFLLQKHCSCSQMLPDCCSSGWKVTLAGSRFLSGAEERYAAIEGEALAIAWGLQQTRYFTQGCNDLLVITDHKPLVKIFSDRTLDEITNTRLFRLKQRTLPWNFTIQFMPGKSNTAADATSRHPLGDFHVNSLSVHDVHEQMIADYTCCSIVDLAAVSWDQIAAETATDRVLSQLLKGINEEFHGEYPLCNQYIRYRDALYVQDDAVMLNDRVVIPESLRKHILSALHAAHQGVSTMLLRAQEIMYWPGMTNDIRKTREQCDDCNTNAPSQPALPAKEITLPLTPFEQIFADYFCFAGHNYLIVGDRLSGWTEIFSTPSGTPGSGARGLVKCLRRMFSMFGVPMILSSDGGPEFAAEFTRDFLRKWGVQHRISSAYNPKSNGRAEVAVKSAKRLLRSNINKSGSLDSDKLLRAMLTFRNTPDMDCHLSPAQILFGHPLRDALSFSSKLRKFSYPMMSRRWREAWDLKEDALRTRYVRNTENMNRTCKPLPPLKAKDRCFIQNGHGNHPRKWGSTGEIMEVLPFDKYVIKVDGSRKLTTRNRRFLKLYSPVITDIEPVGVNGPIDHPSYTREECSRGVVDEGGHDVPDADLPTMRDGGGEQVRILKPIDPKGYHREHISSRNPADSCERTRDTCERTSTSQPSCSDPVLEKGSDEVLEPPTPSPALTKVHKPKLMVRRLKEHNEHGVKQFMKNPAGRRSMAGMR